MKIAALEQYGIELFDDDVTSRFGSNLAALNGSMLEIDLCGCILDYPAMSRVVDGAMAGLGSAEAPRMLRLIFDIPFHEQQFIKWFFFEGQLLTKDKYDSALEVASAHISSELKNRQTKIEICIRNPETRVPEVRWTYG